MDGPSSKGTFDKFTMPEKRKRFRSQKNAGSRTELDRARFNAKIEAQLAENQEEAILYKGKRIKNGHDLLEFIDLQTLMNPENIKKATMTYNDELFNQLLDNLLPSKDTNYTKMGVGDIMFNLEQADQLTYDIVDESILKKKRAEELAREKERQLMKMRKQGATSGMEGPRSTFENE